MEKIENSTTLRPEPTHSLAHPAVFHSMNKEKRKAAGLLEKNCRAWRKKHTRAREKRMNGKELVKPRNSYTLRNVP